MVRWIRTAQMAGGKTVPAAVAWSKEIAEFVKKYEGMSSIGVFMDLFGDEGTIRWICDYEDLATLEKVHRQVMADQEYWQMLGKAEGFFIEGKVHDVVMGSI